MSESDTPKVTCTECRDLEFARNLRAQMEQGYGRHNSNRSFRESQWPPPGHPLLESGPYTPAPSERRTIASIDWALPGSESTQARVVGRFENGAIRSDWRDCRIGDAIANTVDFEGYSHGHPFMRLLSDNRFTPVLPPDASLKYELIEYWTFERVRVMIRDSNGWRDETFWKRIE